MILVTFWYNNESIFAWNTESHPHFHEGDWIYLEISSTPLGKHKFPKAPELKLQPFIIKNINYSLKKEYSNDIINYCTIEIELTKSLDGEEI